MTLRFIPCLLVVAACAGSTAGTGGPVANRSPETTVKAFLSAARDTNLTLMATYWGGSSGPATRVCLPGGRFWAMWHWKIWITNMPLANQMCVFWKPLPTR